MRNYSRDEKKLANKPCALLPPVDRTGSNQSGAIIFVSIAHAERVTIGKVIRDIPVVEKGDMRALSRQTHVIPIIFFVAMRE